jgi:valyl-tRNA synthetase
MLADGSGDFIPVATTRPETILGDTAVAVHPDDERYTAMIGKKVLVPILGREIPVIADDYVEREFGTGALKITPGHDPHDYEIGQRHGLGVINILNKDASMNENAGMYQGLDRFDCREKIWSDMASQGLVIKEELYILNVPRSQRGGEIIEPLVSTQWFVKIEPLAKAALEAVKDGRIKIVPERFTKVYYNWMENIQDWCISRQLWWGHRIPVWYCDTCQAVSVSRTDLVECPKCGSDHIHQDPDVLDTWFSSGLWPFSILGWPEETPDYKYFYPTSVLETGYDILFFWVSRMIMDGLEFTGQVPFHTVYLNGIIRDEKGQKMSKTKNNAIDPLTVIDELGTDALRFTLLVGSTPGNDMSISVKKIEANRNFTNKVWNIGRFVIGALEKAPHSADGKANWSLADSWIWARMKHLIRDVENLFQTHQYGEAGRQIYDFIWGDFADWYLEISKIQMENGGDNAYFTAYTLCRVFDTCLRLLHPFTPYVTEAMWDYLKEACTEDFPGFAPKGGWEDALIIAKWPEITDFEGWEEQTISDFSLIQEIIRSIRNSRAEKKVGPGKKIPAIIIAGDKTDILQNQSPTLCALAGLDAANVMICQDFAVKNEEDIVLVVNGVEIRLPLTGLINHEAEILRIKNELMEVENQILRLGTLLAGAFSSKAPAAVVAKEREKLAAFQETAKKLKEQLG